MTLKRTEMTKHRASMKGVRAGAGVVSTAVLFYLWWPLGIFGAGLSAYLVYDWLRFRGKWGMRF